MHTAYPAYGRSNSSKHSARLARSLFVTLALSCTIGSLLVHADSAAGQPPEMELPWSDIPPGREGASVRAAAVGTADARIGRFSARRASARSEARQRAANALHAWVDDALAVVRVGPRTATAVHAAIDRDLRVVGVRPLVDGGAVVLVEVPVSVLRDACGNEGLPWVD